MQKLSRTFYNRDTLEVARDLLGKYLVHKQNNIEYIAKIVEVEAYIGTHDLASHSSRGLTSRNQPMFGPPGYAYIYLIYGIHHCFNVVTEKRGSGSAVLIRAVEPLKNIVKRTCGPGLLTKAMHIDKSFNGHDLASDDLYIAETNSGDSFIVVERPRIGVGYAQSWAKALFRFYIKDNPFVSKK